MMGNVTAKPEVEATPPTVKIQDDTATLVRDGPHPIYLLPNGKFAVYWGGCWTTRPSFRGIERVIAVSRKSLKLMNERGVIVDAVEMTRTWIVDRTGKKRHGGGSWYLYDAKLLAKAQAITAKIAALYKALRTAEASRDAVLRKRPGVDRYNFQEHLSEAK